ncbi:MAG TPA: cupin domain-containing protein [Rhizomicrobium sp.]
MVILISQSAGIPKESLDSLGPVKKPITHPAAALTGRKFIDEAPGIDSMGIWECSPGRWERTVKQEEFAHFVKGSARFTPAHGEPIDIRAGDTIWFPANTGGVWEITEDVRKVYVIIDRPTLWREFKRFFKTKLRRWLGLSPAPAEPQQNIATGAAPVTVWRSVDEQPQRP